MIGKLRLRRSISSILVFSLFLLGISNLSTCALQTDLLLKYPASPSKLATALNAGRSMTIVFYGTSLTADGNWSNQLTADIDARFPGLVISINSGSNGKDSNWGLDNLSDNVISYHPDAVFIEFSINDARNKIGLYKSKNNTKEMIKELRDSNPDMLIVLQTMNPVWGQAAEAMPDLADYYSKYTEISSEDNVELVDHYVNWAILKDFSMPTFVSYLPDKIHPSRIGCSLVMIPVLEQFVGITVGKAIAAKSQTFRHNSAPSRFFSISH
jgi:acyl-CoA thioesterase I